MTIIRPVHPDDLDALVELASRAGFGLTTLPNDRDLLSARIAASVQSFEKKVDKPGGEIYLLVMEDLRTGKVVGTSAVTAKVGGYEPFYAFKIENSLHVSDALNVRKENKFLKLVEEHNGPCEVGSLFLLKDYRKNGNGRLLSIARFLLIADHPKRFDPNVIAELRGVIDQGGRSEFWDAIGKHFFDVDYPKADYLSMVNKKFIADLIPRHPIYVPLLPPAAQAVIGQVHENTVPALKILEEEGFTPNGMVDIFDAGPVVAARRDQIRTVAQNQKAKVADVTDEPVVSIPYVVSAGKKEFRAARGTLIQTPQGIKISSALALTLNLKVGDPIRFIPLLRDGETHKD